MRFGLHTGQHHVRYAELRELWRSAAGWGFDACYVFDHFRPLHSDDARFLPEEADSPDGPCLEGFATLAALARQVPEVRVGMMVAGVGYRSAALLGHVAATLQQAAAGRLELGIGAGWFEPEYRPYGYEFAPPRQRVERLRRTLDALLAWWRGDAATVPELGLDELPVLPLRPMPRLWIAGVGEKRIIPLAARYADSWNAMFLTPGEYRHKVEVLGAACERIGRPLERIERSIALRAFCHADGDRARAACDGWARGRGHDPTDAAARSLVGAPAECAAQIAAYRDAGATHIAVMAHPPYDLPGLELLAREGFSPFGSPR